MRHPSDIAFALLLACSLTSRAAAQAPALVHETFEESLRTDAPSAGEVFRGVHQTALDARPNFAALSVALPTGSQRMLCITLETQDGRYFAKASYRLDHRATPAERTLRLPTTHRSLLESLAIRDISVIAFLAESCATGQAGGQLFVPVLLGTRRSQDGTIVLLINSRTPGVTVRIFQESLNRYADCSPDVVTPRQVAFNVECRVDIPPGTHLTDLTVVRNRAEKVLPSQTITVYIP